MLSYDEWKLSSPPEDDFCRDCDRDQIIDQAHDLSACLQEDIMKDRDMNQALKMIADLIRRKLDLHDRSLMKRCFDETSDHQESSEIMNLLREQTKETISAIFDDSIDDQLKDDLLSSSSLCRSCHDEDHADDYRDDL
jgi:hypothetical protein